ncbi:MAG: hypothetical protein R3225_05955 [Halofilum sp. (in: g-proteobacteria)]|nr:hypothetical protein [Halofilum sp. (in: g-proteobacteria)]
MAEQPFDWRALRGPGIAALVAATLLGGVAYAAAAWLDGKQLDFRRARGELARAASQYRSASDDKAVYEEYAARFRQLERDGMVGEERRLSWVEALQAANKELKLPVLRYDISPQRDVPLADADFDTGRFNLHRSDMEVRFGALHEGDVLRLLESLAEQGDGLMDAQSCGIELARSGGEVRLDAASANLEVICRLNWYTLEIEREEDR